MADITYTNPASMRPDASKLPLFMQGVQYNKDRSDYENQVSLQDLMQQMGAQQTMAEQPSKIASNIATNNAEAMYVGPRKQEEVRGKTLENDLSAGTMGSKIGTANLELDIKKRGEQITQLRRGVEMASVLRGVAANNDNPAVLSQVMQRLGQGTDEVSQFIGGAKDRNDLLGRIDHVMDIYKKLDMDYQKKLLDYKAAQARTTRESRPGIWEQHVNTLTRNYMAQGMPELQARTKATQDVMRFQAREGGLTQASPEVQGQQALARAVAEGRANIALLPDGPLKQRMMKHYDDMEKTLKSGGEPAAPGKAQHNMEQLKQMYPGRSDKEIKDAYKNKFGVEPN